MNVSSVAEADAILEKLPLGQAKLVEFELVEPTPLTPSHAPHRRLGERREVLPNPNDTAADVAQFERELPPLSRWRATGDRFLDGVRSDRSVSPSGVTPAISASESVCFIHTYTPPSHWQPAYPAR
jgi:hypothetical protein